MYSPASLSATVLQFVDSDCIEESLLITCGVDLRSRIWNLGGCHVGTLLHGPLVVRCREWVCVAMGVWYPLGVPV